MARQQPVPRCPIRVGEPCTLCVPGVSGPDDCGLVYLVRSDPELAQRLADLRAADRAARAARPAPITRAEAPTGG